MIRAVKEIEKDNVKFVTLIADEQTYWCQYVRVCVKGFFPIDYIIPLFGWKERVPE